MSTLVHKLLIDGRHIITNLDVPISYLSEEASEGRNKEFSEAPSVKHANKKLHVAPFATNF